MAGAMLHKPRRQHQLWCEEEGRTRRRERLLRRRLWLVVLLPRSLTLLLGRQLVEPWCLKEGTRSRQLLRLGLQLCRLDHPRRKLL